jgi:hypothetical protein
MPTSQKLILKLLTKQLSPTVITSVALSEVCGKSEGKIFQDEMKSVGILLRCLRYGIFQN